jgi:hypothetical protein
VDGHLHQLAGQREPEPQARQCHHEQHGIPGDLNADQLERVTKAKKRVYDVDLFRHLDGLEFEASRILERDAVLEDRLTRASREAWSMSALSW